jgi:ankyrin repeat protein
MSRKSLTRRFWIVACTAISFTTQGSINGDDSAVSKPKVDFQADVAPILKQHCVDCHGPGLQLADLRLDQRKFAIVDGRDRELVVPGKSADSLLIQRLVDKQLGLIMPPTFPFFPEDKVGLPEAQILTLKRWIDEGAVWPEGITLASDPSDTAEVPGVRALWTAIRAADHQAVSRLLADRTLANVRDRKGSTPVLHAALYGDVALLQLVAEHGGDINAADHAGATALMLAAGDLAKVQWLVEHGAQVNVRSTLERTPLLIASTQAGNAPVVKFLLKSGAKVTDRDRFGETVLTSAAKCGDVTLIEALIAAGADVRRGGGFMGRTPLESAAEMGHFEALVCLLKHGAADDRKSLNASLFNACVRGPTEAVRLLLAHGADARLPSGFAAYTPLMGATYSENVDLDAVKQLLQHGADVQSKAATGDTALQLAAKRGPTDIVALLEQTGAKSNATPPVAPPANAAPPTIREAAEKSLALLQKCGPEFFRKSGCVACHHQSVTSLALAEARSRGFKVDEQTAREQMQITAYAAKSFRDQFLQRVDHPGNSAPGTGYVLMGLAAEGYPADEFTDANIIVMANRQSPDGSWTAFGHRPPLEYSRVAATALAIRALQLYSPPGLKVAFDERMAKGREWLIAVEPASNSDRAFRLLGLAWCGAGPELIQFQTSALVAQQRHDGGWAQLEKLDSDAYATGLTLYALHHGGGIATSDRAYQDGVNYLLKSQLPDGSWHVKTRSFPFQPYFESGFPHGPDQWISASATGFAAAALIDAEPPLATSAQ